MLVDFTQYLEEHIPGSLNEITRARGISAKVEELAAEIAALDETERKLLLERTAELSFRHGLVNFQSAISSAWSSRESMIRLIGSPIKTFWI